MFAQLDENETRAICTLTARQARVWLALRLHGSGVVWPGLNRLSDLTGLDKRGLQKALKSLESRKWIKRKSGTGRKTTRYTLLGPPKVGMSESATSGAVNLDHFGGVKSAEQIDNRNRRSDRTDTPGENLPAALPPEGGDAASAEIWVKITDTVEVSNMGNVRSWCDPNGKPIDKPRPKATRKINTGYLTTSIKSKDRLIHRMVCHAFNGPPPTPKHQAAHKDGSRTNNAAANLYWATAKENAADRRRHGTQVEGETHGRAKLTNAQVDDIRASPKSNTELAKEYGVSNSAMSKLRNGHTYKNTSRLDRLRARAVASTQGETDDE